MGYMGFGLQKWIYTQKSRRPFSKNRLPVGDIIENTGIQKDSINVEGRTSAHVEEIDKNLNIISERISIRRKIGIFHGYLIIISLIVFVSILAIKIIQFNHRLAPLEKKSEKEIIEEQAKAFQMMIDYGDTYLKKKDFEKAISEYKQAVLLYPDKLTGEILLAKGYYLMCINSNQSCDTAIMHYSKLIEKYPDSTQYYKIRAEIYSHMGDFENADKDLNKLTK